MWTTWPQEQRLGYNMFLPLQLEQKFLHKCPQIWKQPPLFLRWPSSMLSLSSVFIFTVRWHHLLTTTGDMCRNVFVWIWFVHMSQHTNQIRFEPLATWTLELVLIHLVKVRLIFSLTEWVSSTQLLSFTGVDRQILEAVFTSPLMFSSPQRHHFPTCNYTLTSACGLFSVSVR